MDLHRMSLLQNNQETGITYSGTPSGLWIVPTAKLVLRWMVPPPILWTQLHCFLEVTDMVAL